MNGYIDCESFGNLKYLKFLNIFNDGRKYEQEPNYFMNSLWYLDTKCFEFLTELEDINLQNLNMNGYIGEDFVNLNKLRYVDLSGNNLTSSLPDVS